MWSQTTIESWIFNKLEFVETIIVEYIITLWGMLIHPRTTLKKVFDKEIVSSFIFFFINLSLVTIINNFYNVNELIKILLKSFSVTTKPTSDDVLFSMLGILIGTLLFTYLFRFISFLIARKKVPFDSIMKPIFYSSFLFIPIMVFKKIVCFLIYGQLISLFNGEYDFIIFMIIIFLVYILMLFWWTYVFYLGLKIKSGENPGIKYSLITTLTLICFIFISFLTSNIDNFQKIPNIYMYEKCTLEANIALTKKPPDYLFAANVMSMRSAIKGLAPRRRYCDRIISMIYFSKLVNGFETDIVMNKLNENKYEEIESYYENNFDKIINLPHTHYEKKYLDIIKNLLRDIKKDEDDIRYVRDDNETKFTFTFPLIAIEKRSHDLRIIP